MNSLPFLIGTMFACACTAFSQIAPQWHFESSGGVPDKLVWQTEDRVTYFLFQSSNLSEWKGVTGFPKVGFGAAMEHSFTAGTQGFFRIVSENPPPEGFTLVHFGEFLMGDRSDPLVGNPVELPVHRVYLGSFYVARFEVTKALWDEVRAWGLNNGYTDLPTGGGKGPDHPVQEVNWYDCVKWCNARSQKESLTPCYTTVSGTYKTGNSAPQCDWNANGYRLPTEAEWERAARSSFSKDNFPAEVFGTNTITHTQANYFSSDLYSYDVSPTRGYHPWYDIGSPPYTSPVGRFRPNSYGLFDMAGNVWEWCWDRFGSYPSTLQTNPRGPASGSDRVYRGGSWFSRADGCRIAYRNYISSGMRGNDLGFRLARGSVP